MLGEEVMYIVKRDGNIIDVLKDMNISKNKIKTYVKLGFISVNGDVVKKLPCVVKIGDIIDIKKNEIINFDINIIYEDSNYLVFHQVYLLLEVFLMNIL